MKYRNLALLPAVLLSGCFFKPAEPTAHKEDGKEVRDVLDARVATCTDLAHEIAIMTQTTAELRKVLLDMELLTCASKEGLGSTSGPPPDCSPGTAIPYYGTWTCQTASPLQQPKKSNCNDDETVVMIMNSPTTAQWACAKKDAIR